MSPKRIGPLAEAWYRWKALRLPWRRRFLIGFDLDGNTYWEFRLTRGPEDSSERWRRIVSYPRSTHYSQVKVSPQWHQWLRYTRREPPTMEEQRDEVVRQARMKQLAAVADARWEAKPRVMEAPRERSESSQGLPPPPLGNGGSAAKSEDAVVSKPSTTSKVQEDTKADDPWGKAKAQGPGENWQPTAWNPTAGKKK